METAQTGGMLKPESVVSSGLWDFAGHSFGCVGESEIYFIVEESGTVRHRRCKPCRRNEIDSLGRTPKYRGTRGILWESGKTIS